MTARVRRLRWPAWLLAMTVVLSLAARLALLDEPCVEPCRTAGDHVLVFDEVYYVGAARVIAGLPPLHDQRYAGAPAGEDPNSEHPQLVKLLIAGGIDVLGDGPLAWRWVSLVAGTLAILGMWALARAAGASDAVAAVAAFLLAADNLVIVHGRIGTLDMPALAGMLWAVALALRRRWLAAAVTLALAAACKEVALLAGLAIVVIELAGPDGTRWRRATRAAGFVAATVALWIVALELMGLIAAPYDPAKHRTIAGGALAEISHIISFGARQTSPHGPAGIASQPWAWLVDIKPIVYLNINPRRPSPDLQHVHPAAHFLGMISPPVLLLGLVGLVLAVVGRVRGRLPRISLAWLAATYLPLLGASVFGQRTSYLYYMLLVMPGFYLLGADRLVVLASCGRVQRRLAVGYAAAVVVAAVAMFPFTPIP